MKIRYCTLLYDLAGEPLVKPALGNKLDNTRDGDDYAKTQERLSWRTQPNFS